MRPAITVEQLGKQYQIGDREIYETLRDAIMQKFRYRGEHGRKPVTKFWALGDVSFNVGQGEVVGIIGRNGAGKSTLLKILSRITEPTTGRIDFVRASWQSSGSGDRLPPGAYRTRKCLSEWSDSRHAACRDCRKFDEIVAFAEVERFIDMPVKRYSSGMYLRLAFSVAAFLESEILLVDEVLAVGDSSFQKRCLGKMRDISAGGRTVIFVSHNMAAIESLCTSLPDDLAGESALRMELRTRSFRNTWPRTWPLKRHRPTCDRTQTAAGE